MPASAVTTANTALDTASDAVEASLTPQEREASYRGSADRQNRAALVLAIASLREAIATFAAAVTALEELETTTADHETRIVALEAP